MTPAKEYRLSQTLAVVRGGAGLTVHQVADGIGVKRVAAAGYLAELEALGYVFKKSGVVQTGQGVRNGYYWYAADGGQ